MQPPEYAPGGGQGGGMQTWQKIALGCGGLVVLGVLLAVVLVVGIAIRRSSGEQAAGSPPPVDTRDQPGGVEPATPSEEPPPAEPGRGAAAATVRVTGTEGLTFTGDVGTLDGSRTVEGTVPQEYEVQVRTGEFDFDSVSAFFSRDFADESDGTLGVQIVYDGEVVKESETSAQAGSYRIRLVTIQPG